MAETKTGRLAFLAIFLPFLGVVFGATLEHGAGFLCKTGLVACKASASQTDALETALNALIAQTEVLSEQNRSCQASMEAALASLRQAERQVASNPQSAVQSLRAAQTQLNPDIVFEATVPQLNLNQIERELPQIAPRLQAIEGLTIQR